MTEFRGISSGKTVTTKNNMNNVKIGDKIEVTEGTDKNKIVGIVSDICHLVSKWNNHQGLERSTHDIIIDIDDKGDGSRPQNRWKPSNEQMKALESIIPTLFDQVDIISELYIQLKAL